MQIPISALADEVGPHGIPTVLAFLLAAVGLALGARSLIARRAAKTGEEEEREATPLRALGLLAVASLYIPLASFLGYVPALFLLIAAIALYEGTRLSWHLPLIAAGGALVFWLLFVFVLGVPQPAGMLF